MATIEIDISQFTTTLDWQRVMDELWHTVAIAQESWTRMASEISIPQLPEWQLEAARGLDLHRPEHLLEHRYRMMFHSTRTIAHWISWLFTDYGAGPEPSGLHQEVASAIVKDTGPKARDMLARALHGHVRRLADEISPDWDPDRMTRAEDGILWLDTRLARYLEAMGAYGAKQATHIREKARARWQAHVDQGENRALWRLWVDPSRPDLALFPVLMARVIWNDRVVQEWRALQEAKAPALTHSVVDSFLAIAGPGVSIEGNRVFAHGNQCAELERERVDTMLRHNAIGLAVPDTLVGELISTRLRAIRTMDGIRLFRHLIWQGFDRVKLQGRPAEPFEYIVTGGLSELARRIGSDQTHRDTIHDALDGLSIIRLTIQGDTRCGSDWLLAYSDLPARGQRQSQVRLTINRPLQPNYTFELSGPGRLLTPIPAELPPFVGRPADRAPQVLLQYRVLQHFAEHSIELAGQGGIEIKESDWAWWADECGVNPRLLPDIRTAYQGSVIERAASGWTLTGRYAAELDLILEQGRIRLGWQNKRTHRSRVGSGMRLLQNKFS